MLFNFPFLILFMNFLSQNTDTIIALATAQGTGAIAVIRLSGNDAISLVNRFFKGKNLEKQATHSLHFGTIRNAEHIDSEINFSIIYCCIW